MTPQKAVIIGASILDITGYPNAVLIPKDSNPGHIFMTPGGVARNIAENLALLQCHTQLISAIGNDIWGNILLNLCQTTNINTDHCIFSKDAPSALYLAIHDTQRDLALAVVNTAIIDLISPEYIETKASFIDKFPIIVIDTNLRTDTLQYLFHRFSNIPIYLDLVSTTKATKVVDGIAKIHTIKANLAEAEVITGIKMQQTSDILAMSDYLLSKGLQQLFITMGNKGSFYANSSECGFVEPVSIEATNTSGAGDAYMAGLAYSYLQQKTLANTAIFASAMSLAALMNPNTVNPHITTHLIQNIINQYHLCSKNISI